MQKFVVVASSTPELNFNYSRSPSHPDGSPGSLLDRLPHRVTREAMLSGQTQADSNIFMLDERAGSGDKFARVTPFHRHSSKVRSCG